VDFRWLAGATLSYIIDGSNPETVRHVGPQREASALIVSCYSLQLFPTTLFQALVLKLNYKLCRTRKKESRSDGERQDINNKEAIET